MKILYVAHGHYWGATWPYAFIDNFIIRALKNLGHEVQVYEMFSQAEKYKDFVSKLAKERNLNQAQILAVFDDRASLALPEMAAQFQPDLILHIVGRIGSNALKLLRQLKLKTAIWFLDDPQEILKTAQMSLLYDYIFTVESQCLPAYQEVGTKNAYFLPLACEPEIDKTIVVPDQYKSDICFIGVCFPRRLQFFDEIADFLKRYKVKIIGGGKNIGSRADPWLWQRKLKRLDVLKDFILDEIVNPEEAAKYYNGAKINLNIHRAPQDERFTGQHNIAPTGVSGRTFEIAGCGAFQLIDNLRDDYNRHFKVGKEIISFTDLEDFKSKVAYYLAHDAERQQIAQSAQRRAYDDHTYEKRLEYLLAQCQV
jgi:spore maturation protein CgeB